MSAWPRRWQAVKFIPRTPQLLSPEWLLPPMKNLNCAFESRTLPPLWIRGVDESELIFFFQQYCFSLHRNIYIQRQIWISDPTPMFSTTVTKSRLILLLNSIDVSTCTLEQTDWQTGIKVLFSIVSMCMFMSMYTTIEGLNWRTLSASMLCLQGQIVQGLYTLCPKVQNSTISLIERD